MNFTHYTLYNSWQDFPKQITIENVLALVTRLVNAPISALVQHFDNSLGEIILGIKDHPFLVVYPGVATNLAGIIHGLLDTGDIVLKLCDPSLYYLLGDWPQGSIAYTVNGDYLSSHWLPCCLCPSLENREKWDEAAELSKKANEGALSLKEGFEKDLAETMRLYVTTLKESLELPGPDAFGGNGDMEENGDIEDGSDKNEDENEDKNEDENEDDEVLGTWAEAPDGDWDQ